MTELIPDDELKRMREHIAYVLSSATGMSRSCTIDLRKLLDENELLREMAYIMLQDLSVHEWARQGQGIYTFEGYLEFTAERIAKRKEAASVTDNT